MAITRQLPVLFDGTKAIPAWDVDSMTGWTLLSGEEPRQGVDLFFSRVPWLYRGVLDRANNVASMPFALVKGAVDVDTSQDWQNKLAALLPLPNPGRLFQQLEQSLAMAGRAYLFLETNPAGYIKRVQYCNPRTIEEVYDDKTGELVGYKRKVGKNVNPQPVKMQNIVAIYAPDYMAEHGPGKSSAAMAALTASGVLYNADKFVAGFFERGAIKATILTADGSPKEAERLQNWWNDVVTGIKNAWTARVLNLKQVTPTVIGEGLESLSNEQLTAERRQDIATALGIPESRLWSSAANYATAEEDTKNYYLSTIIPECKLIAEAFNEQLFTAAHKLEGYKIVFRHETLELFQADQNEQAQAAKAFIDFLAGCETEGIALATAAMIGFELTEEMEKAIREYFAEKKKREEEALQRMQENQPAAPGQDGGEEEREPEPANPMEMRSILSVWRRKSLHALKLGQSANVPFETDIVPLSLQGAICGQLETARDEQGVKNIFKDALTWRGYP